MIIIGANFTRAHETRRGRKPSDPRLSLLPSAGPCLFRYPTDTASTPRRGSDTYFDVDVCRCFERRRRAGMRPGTPMGQRIIRSFDHSKVDVELLVGKEEKRIRNIRETSTQHTDERYISGILWRSDDIALLDNREAALKRFFGVVAKKLTPIAMCRRLSRTRSPAQRVRTAGRIILNTLMQIRARNVENCGSYVFDWK